MKEAIFNMIKKASVNLPSDVTEALMQAKNQEEKNSRSELSLETILKNIQKAQNLNSPICQDTGLPTFFIKIPEGQSQKTIKLAATEAVKEASEKGFLRPNAVDSINGKNSGDNTGDYFPIFYFEEVSSDSNLEIQLLLKGGGSENVSDQISLPAQLKDYGNAGRNIEGVKKSILQVVKNAQGKGCAPGILSIHIGSDRAGGYYQAKKNLLLPIGLSANIQTEHEEVLKKLESEILEESKKMNIGPMGLGGKTTLLDCKISTSHRLPASFFVSVAYMCWASRKSSCQFEYKNNDWKIIPQKKKGIINIPLSKTSETSESTNIKKLNFPISEEEARSLKIGDTVLLSGVIYTGRDSLHAYAQDNNLSKNISGSAIYHCGPVAIQEQEKWKFTAAGPTTSIREEPYQADFIKKTGIRAVIGKGGMGAKTLQGLKASGAIYLHAIGGAATYYAQSVKEVKSVEYLEFGIPEAMWEIEVKDFLAIVSMDSHGGSLHG